MASEPIWLAKARNEVGFHETGNNLGIDEYIKLAKCGSPGDPWCSIFANAMLESAGVHGSRSAMARSFEHSDYFEKLAQPVLGAVTTMWRGSPGSGQGHVGFFVRDNGKTVTLLGGNQSDQVKEEAQPKGQITGYWWPKASPTPDDTKKLEPIPAGKLFTGITATEFTYNGKNKLTAYPDVAEGWPDRPGVALPFHFHGPRPKVRITYKGKTIDAPVVDVGPWNTHDAYWEVGARPQAETGTDTFGRDTNLAGIDLTPATARAIGLPGKGKVDWQFVTEKTPMPDIIKPPAPPITPAPQPIDLSTLLPLIESIVKGLTTAPQGGTPPIKGALSFFDKLFGGRMLAGKKTELGILSGAGISIAQVLGIIGPAFGAVATPPGQIMTIVWVAFTALSALARFTRAIKAKKATQTAAQ